MQASLLRTSVPYFIVISLLSVFGLFVGINVSLGNIAYQQLTDELRQEVKIVSNFLPLYDLESESSIKAFCKQATNGTDIEILILNRAGSIIGSSSRHILFSYSPTQYVEFQAAMAGKIGISSKEYLTDSEFVRLAMPLYVDNEIEFILMIAKDLNTIKNRFNSLTGGIVIIGLFILLASIVALIILIRSLNKPLSVLQQAAEEFASGNLDFSFVIDEPKELQGLGSTLTYMAEEIRSQIAEIQNQRNELESILSSMVEAVIVLDSDLNVKKFNNGAFLLTQNNNIEKIGKSLLQAFRISELQEIAEQAFNSSIPVEKNITIYASSIRHLQVHGSLILRNDNSKDGVLLVLNDITRLKKLENVRKEFVSNVSHELKTPIASIKGFVETLQEGAMENPRDAKRFLDIIENHSNRLESIIEDLLSLSRLEQAQGEIKKQSLSLSDILQNAVEYCNPKAHAKKIDIILSGDSEIVLNANRTLLEQAIINLIDNAIKYSPANTQVFISCEKDNEKVILSVKDQGKGIPQADIPRIFERFYRVDKARSRDLGGTGLGLAIVRHIIGVHGGDVSVRSEVNKGSVFKISLPIK